MQEPEPSINLGLNTNPSSELRPPAEALRLVDLPMALVVAPGRGEELGCYGIAAAMLLSKAKVRCVAPVRGWTSEGCGLSQNTRRAVLVVK